MPHPRFISSAPAGSWLALVSLGLISAALPLFAYGADPAPAATLPELFGIPIDFIIFATILLGVALFHRHTLAVALTGVTVLIAYKLLFTGFKTGPGFPGFGLHMAHEWVILTNLLGLLLGFALLAKHFEDSHIPAVLPRFLPNDWKGAFFLLVMIFVLSSFLDNIAAGMIGGTMALTVFRKKVHIGYLAAIVAASNAGGAGSVVGDTTTTMMWIAGVPAIQVLDAYVAAGLALVICGIPAALQQHRVRRGGEEAGRHSGDHPPAQPAAAAGVTHARPPASAAPENAAARPAAGPIPSGSRARHP